jgi:hypothetical protein
MRRLVGLGLLATVLAFVLMTAPAQAQVPPTVRIAGTTAMSETGQCFTEPTFSPGSFTLERDQTSGALDVTYHISGGPTDLNSDPAAGEDHTASFVDGQAQLTVTVSPALGGGPATVTIVDGAAYDLGDPGTATIQKAISIPQCVEEPPTTPPTTAPTRLARTGSHSSTFGLVLIGLGLIVVGFATKRAAVSRLR